MRILNVTETYAPFLEFGGPPVKVRALSEGLARRGHTVTVLTADWGLEKRLQAQEGKVTGELRLAGGAKRMAFRQSICRRGCVTGRSAGILP
jgi:glycogen synthase